MCDFIERATELVELFEGYVSGIEYQDEPSLGLEEKLRRQQPPLPATPVLAHVLQVAYEATFTRDEGRWTRFVLELIPAGAADHRSAAPPDMRFSEPVPLLSAALRSVASAHEDYRNSLLVSVDPDPQKLGIRTHLTGPDHSANHGLTVEGLDPGRLRVSWLGYRFMDIVAEEREILAPGQWTAEDLGALTNGLLQSGGIELLPVLSFLIRSIQDQGHGGSVWITPEPHRGTGLRVRFPVDDPGPASRTDRSNRRAWIRTVGRLTAVDGAVLLDTRAILHGFGVFIEEQMEVDVLHVQAGQNEVRRSSSIGGGRHRAGMAFCASRTPAVAVVVSEDGPITLMGRGQPGTQPWDAPVGTDSDSLPFYGRVSDLGRAPLRRYH